MFRLCKFGDLCLARRNVPSSFRNSFHRKIYVICPTFVTKPERNRLLSSFFLSVRRNSNLEKNYNFPVIFTEIKPFHTFSNLKSDKKSVFASVNEIIKPVETLSNINSTKEYINSKENNGYLLDFKNVTPDGNQHWKNNPGFRNNSGFNNNFGFSLSKPNLNFSHRLFSTKSYFLINYESSFTKKTSNSDKFGKKNHESSDRRRFLSSKSAQKPKIESITSTSSPSSSSSEKTSKKPKKKNKKTKGEEIQESVSDEKVLIQLKKDVSGLNTFDKNSKKNKKAKDEKTTEESVFGEKGEEEDYLIELQKDTMSGLNVSSLYVPSHLQNKYHSVLDPYMKGLHQEFSHLENLLSEVKKRGLDQRFSMTKLERLKTAWGKLVDLKSLHVVFEGKLFELSQVRHELVLKTREAGGGFSDNKKFHEVKEEIKKYKNELRKLKHSIASLEDTFVPEMLAIPNKLSVVTPLDNDEVILQIFDPPKFETGVGSPLSHVDLGKKYKNLEFSQVSPGAFYLKGDLALKELEIEDIFCEKLFLHGYLQQTNPDFGKGVTVEGCGYDVHDSESVLKMVYHEADKDTNPQFLMGGSSLPSFAGYFAKKIIKKTEKFLPQKLFCVGRKYKPLGTGGNYSKSTTGLKTKNPCFDSGLDFSKSTTTLETEDTIGDAGIFSSIQSTCISAFVVYQNEESSLSMNDDRKSLSEITADKTDGDDYIQPPKASGGFEFNTGSTSGLTVNFNSTEERVVNDILSVIKEAYMELGLHFRIVKKSAKNLKSIESWALSIEMLTTTDLSSLDNKSEFFANETENSIPIVDEEETSEIKNSSKSHTNGSLPTLDEEGTSEIQDASTSDSKLKLPQSSTLSYVEVGRISILGDYVSRRLLMLYGKPENDSTQQRIGKHDGGGTGSNEKLDEDVDVGLGKQNKNKKDMRLGFAGSVYVELADVSRVLAVYIENTRQK